MVGQVVVHLVWVGLVVGWEPMQRQAWVMVSEWCKRGARHRCVCGTMWKCRKG